MGSISDHRLAEKTLRESEPFARSVLDSLSANIAVLNESGTIVFVNRAWREFARSNEAVGNVAENANYLQVCESAVELGSEDAASFAEGIRSVLSGRRDEFALEYPCHSPTEQRWFVGQVTRFPSGSPAWAVVAHENITERKQDEEIRARLAAIVESSEDAIIAKTLEGVITDWNRGAQKIYGYSAEEVLGKPINILVPPERPNEIPMILEKLRRGEAIDHYETVRVAKDGRRLNISLTISPIRDSAGNIAGASTIARNITQRKRTEEALRLRDRAIAASSNGIVITDPGQPDNPITYVSPAFERISGYSAQEVLGRNCRFLQGTDREQPALEELRAALQEGRGCQAVLRNYKKDGTLFWNELSISPVHDEEGHLISFVGVQNDVTERRRAEEALRDSEERYRALYEDNPSMYFTLDEKGTVLSVNHFGSKQLGYAPEELVGRPLLEIFHEEDRQAVSHYLSGSLQAPERISGWEARKIRKDGSVLWVRENVRAVRGPDGDTVILVTCEDVTERKHAESERARLLDREQVARGEAEAARQHLRAILDNLTEGVLVAEPQGRIVFANSAANTMLGSTNEKTLEELPDLWEDFNLPEAVGRCARNGENIEARVSHGESYLRVRLECLVNDERRDVLVVIQDLSEGHRLEANQQRFLANAAHELKTPLMAVMGAAELLATGEDADPDMRRRLLNHIFSEGRRMQRLADALLRLSRVGWDPREPNQVVVDLRAAGQQAAELAEPLVESAGLRLNIQGEGTRVCADAEWLQEVLLVLLSNAIKHSSRGGDIRLHIEDSAVTVEDEGAGISPIDLPHVFERFYRGKGSSEGFGLGLPICKELTERMGGSIAIRSREGIGTTVKVELPKADLDAQDTDSRR
ncbi:MAG: PAS domain S-box protein [Actinomycetota bacterium]|nr:PAS domain S-box protein [Actinomycetota bacterium]